MEILQFFEYTHLPSDLQMVSYPFHQVAHQIDVSLPDNSEKEMALRKLLEARDCAVRSTIMKSVQ